MAQMDNEALPRAITKETSGVSRAVMQKTINDLVQLQDLLEARLQQETMSPGSRLKELDASIAAMVASLPDGLGPRFERLHRRLHLAIVPIANGICSGCGIQLPVSLGHTVRALKDLHSCPNCARILYATDDGTSSKAVRPRRAAVPRTVDGIARFSAPTLMLPGLAVGSRDEVIRTLCEQIAAEGYAPDADRLLEQALRREAIVPTAIENGLAFPHVRGADGAGLTLALATCPDGVVFHPDLGKATRIVVFATIPAASSAFYLRLLAGMVKSLETDASRKKLLAAKTPAALWKTVLQLTRRHIV